MITKSGNIEIVKYILNECETYYASFSDKNYYNSIYNDDLVELIYNCCYSGNLKLVKFIIKSFNINMTEINNSCVCLRFFENVEKWKSHFLSKSTADGSD